MGYPDLQVWEMLYFMVANRHFKNHVNKAKAISAKLLVWNLENNWNKRGETEWNWRKKHEKTGRNRKTGEKKNTKNLKKLDDTEIRGKKREKTEKKQEKKNTKKLKKVDDTEING